MKKILLGCIGLILMLLFIRCSTINNYINRDYALKTYKDKKGNKNIIGKFSIEDLLKTPEFSIWYHHEYENYTVDPFFKQNKRPLQKLFKHKIVSIFMGTWCSDSRREVPRFMKIIDFLKIPHSHIILIGVNRQKKAFSGEELGKNITKVPTFIFYKKDMIRRKFIEIGRIVESPAESLEKDIYKILSAKAYEAR